jgi:TRAP-type C4-dicarboxylate transport system substrate-binding protein
MSARTITLAGLLASAVAALASTGCAGSSAAGDKAGGSQPGPIILHMAGTPHGADDVPPIQYFVERVAALSRGAVTIKVLAPWGGYAPNAEAGVIHAVAGGSVQLGWVGTRVFDTLGDPSFDALSAPMLIDGYPLERAVLDSDIPGRMLATLGHLGVTGIGLFGGDLRLPIGVRKPLLGPADWSGLTIGTYRSGVQESAIRALGARPYITFGGLRPMAVANGTIQGFEFDVRRYASQSWWTHAPYITANLVLWPEFDAVVVNPSALASLDEQQRHWLAQAAQQAAAKSVALVGADAGPIRTDCAGGARFVDATQADLAATRRALRPVYAQLNSNPQTRMFIRELASLKHSIAAGPALSIPASCLHSR